MDIQKPPVYKRPVRIGLLVVLALLALVGGQERRSVDAASPQAPLAPGATQAVIGGVDLGDLTDYLFFFADARTDANWEAASKGFVGDVAVDGSQASERTAGTVPYAGTISTDDTTLSAWQDIVDDNPGQAFASTGNTALISQLETTLNNAFTQINGLSVSSNYGSFSFNGVSSTSLNGLNTTDSTCQTFVINITSGLLVSSQINITGDACDVFIMRWDSDANFSDGYEGEVKFESGGAIVPLGGLKASNFIHVAGDINSSGGGSTPTANSFPQGPRLNDGQGSLCTGCADFSGGGFFTGYWLTTGSPANAADATHSVPYGDSSDMSNAIFVGGWYSINTKFSMTSGTSGVYVSPNPATQPLDYGDLPDTGSGTGSGNYRTTASDSGPRHIITGLHLGAAVDGETDGQPNSTATGDDSAGSPDDEDGVTFPALVPGATVTVVVNASGPGKLNAFFDWNNDGDFEDASETQAEVAVVAGNNNLSVTVPGSAVTGAPLGARFRLSSQGGLDADDSGLVGGGSLSTTEFEDFLVVGMRPGAPGEAVTIGSSNELGADRALITSNNGYGTHPAETASDGTVFFGESAKTNVYPTISYADGNWQGDEVTGGPGAARSSRALAPASMRTLFIPAPDKGNDTTFNRWFSGAPTVNDNGGAGTPNVEYLPYTFNGAKEARTFRGIDWSGNVAVTNDSGTYSLADINVFANLGVRSAGSSASTAANIQNTYYFANTSSTGSLMDSLETSGPNTALGWTGGVNFSQVHTDLRTWRTTLRALSVEQTLDFGSGPDLIDKNSISGGGPVVYNVLDSWDTNGDGIVLIEIDENNGTDFVISNSDWVIEGSGNKLVVFRIRDGANMLVNNSSIMLGQGFRDAIGINRLGVLFVHVHPEEEFTSVSGSSDSVFDLQNVIMNGIGLWDLNTIGTASTDTDYGGFVDRTQQLNYTKISHSNAQGCGQFVSGFVYLQNVRWVRCQPNVGSPDGEVEDYLVTVTPSLDYGDAPDTGVGTGVGNYNTTASDSGPSHLIVSNLRLGTVAPDGDSGALQNAAADADDSDNSDDEDGVSSLPSVTTTSTSVPLTVSVLNNTGSNATLACWIDFNRDGDFADTGERASATVSSSASQQNINLTFSGFAAPTAGTSYLRCRLANASGEVANPTGAANSGEVEDYQLTIWVAPTYQLTKRLNTIDPLRNGENISFTIRITNTGTYSLTTVPLTDTYDTTYLTYLGSVPQSDDNNNDGAISWSDLTGSPAGFGIDLGPNQSFEIVVTFVGIADTTAQVAQAPCTVDGNTCNVATVSGARWDPDGPGGVPEQGPLPPRSAHDDVQIIVPTAVALADRLVNYDGSVQLYWRTVNESDVIGFHIYRTANGGIVERITAEMIPAQKPGQSDGAAYEYADAAVAVGNRYSYTVEFVGFDGAMGRESLGEVFSGGRIFLPTIRVDITRASSSVN